MLSRIASSFDRSCRPTDEMSTEMLWDFAFGIVAAMNSDELEKEYRDINLSIILEDESLTEWDRAVRSSVLLFRFISSNAVLELFDEIKGFITRNSFPSQVDVIAVVPADVFEIKKRTLNMLVLNLVKRLHDPSLVSRFVEELLISCSNSIGDHHPTRSPGCSGPVAATTGYSGADHSLEGGVNMGLELTLNVLSTVFVRAVDVSPSAAQALRHRTKAILSNLFSFVDKITHRQSKEYALKMLVVPFLAALENVDDETMVIAVNCTWKQVLKASSDTETASVLLCAILSGNYTSSTEPLKILCQEPAAALDFWILVQKFMLSQEAVVRKRGAFILQKLPKAAVLTAATRRGDSKHQQQSNANANANANASSAREAKSSRHRKLQPQSQQKVEVDDISAATSATTSISASSGAALAPLPSTVAVAVAGYGGSRHWWEDYLDVCEQVEGCSSMHLVQQVWPLLQHLCLSSTTTRETTDDDHDDSDTDVAVVVVDGFGYPAISFGWVKALLHSLLQAQIPNVRKAALRGILGQGLKEDSATMLPISANSTTARWLWRELFPAIDSVGFFSAYFLGRNEDVGCSANGPAFRDDAKPVSLQPKRISVAFYPGVLMPSFLALFIRKLSELSKSRLVSGPDTSKSTPLSKFVVSVISAVCGDSSGQAGGLRSFSASKWILRVFAEDSVLSLVPRCFGMEEVSAVRTYIRTRLARSNGLVREHILQGLLPLLVRAVEPARVPLYELFRVIIPVERLDHHSSSSSSRSDSAFSGTMNSFRRIVSDDLLLRSCREISYLYLQLLLEASSQGGHDQQQHQQGGDSMCVCPLPSDESYLPIIYTIIHLHNSTITTAAADSGVGIEADRETAGRTYLTSLCQQRIDTAVRLYGSAYLSRDTQLRAVWVLRGIAWTALSLYLYRSSSSSQTPSSSPSSSPSSFSSMGNISTHTDTHADTGNHRGSTYTATYTAIDAVLGSTLLLRLTAAVDDIVSYLCFILQQAVGDAFSYTPSSSITNYSAALKANGQQSHVVQSTELIDACTDITSALLLLPSLAANNGTSASKAWCTRTSTSSSSSLLNVAKLISTIAKLLFDSESSASAVAVAGSIAAVRCAEGLLSAIAIAPPTPLPTTSGSLAEDGLFIREAIETLLRSLIAVKGVDAASFRSLTERCKAGHSSSIPAAITTTTTASNDDDRDASLSESLSLVADILLRNTNCQYGRASAMFAESRWAAINLSLAFLSSSRGVEVLSPVKSRGSAAAAASSVGKGFLVSAIEEMDLCPMISLPDIFASCTLTIRRSMLPPLLRSHDSNSSSSSHGDKYDDDQRHDRDGNDGNDAAAVAALLDAAWAATLGGSNSNDVNALNAFIRLAFDSSVLAIIDHEVTHQHYLAVMELGLNGRPHIIQGLVFQLCAVWKARPLLALPFYSEIQDLLLYREPKQDDHNTPDDLDILLALSDQENVSGICRFSVLIFLESMVNDTIAAGTDADSRVTSFLRTLIVSLVDLNKTKEFSTAAMIGSDAFGRKLRCWQALSVLSAFIDEQLLSTIVDDYFLILTHPCAHGIRVPIEVFGAAVGKRFPFVFLPRLLKQLKVFNHTQQTLCSLFVIIGHLFCDTSSPDLRPTTIDAVAVAASAYPSNPGSTENHQTANYLRDRKTVRKVVDHLIPWLSCAAGLPRAVAQMLMHALIPSVIPTDAADASAGGIKDDSKDDSDDEAASAAGYLRSIYFYLDKNRDSAKVIPKQRQFFVDYNPSLCCSVAGLTAHTMDAAGEILPEHMLTLLVDALKEVANEARNCWSEGEKRKDDGGGGERGGSEAKNTNNDISSSSNSNSSSESTSHSSFSSSALQRKIIPFDELQLTLSKESFARSKNAAGRRRQEVVMCASLVDKVTNLAGIARTCEIFAVQQLVMSSLSVTKSEAFLGIAVSCEGWLPMAEVPAHKLALYLRTMRQRGYAVVGLEQTDASQNLATVSELPCKCVLLLGKEKEGIPVELLQEVDIFLEIPQFGVIRSLNVHVSAALALWEITRRNSTFLNNAAASQECDDEV